MQLNKQGSVHKPLISTFLKDNTLLHAKVVIISLLTNYKNRNFREKKSVRIIY